MMENLRSLKWNQNVEEALGLLLKHSVLCKKPYSITCIVTWWFFSHLQKNIADWSEQLEHRDEMRLIMPLEIISIKQEKVPENCMLSWINKGF